MEIEKNMGNVLHGSIKANYTPRSKLSAKIWDMLWEIFPHNVIFGEHYKFYKGTRLYFDFLIKEYNILIEVQGRQHYEFIPHFHEDRNDFLESKKRDNLKREYCQKKDFTLVEIRFDDKIETSKDLLEKIDNALDGGKNDR